MFVCRLVAWLVGRLVVFVACFYVSVLCAICLFGRLFFACLLLVCLLLLCLVNYCVVVFACLPVVFWVCVACLLLFSC